MEDQPQELIRHYRFWVGRLPNGEWGIWSPDQDPAKDEPVASERFKDRALITAHAKDVALDIIRGSNPIPPEYYAR